MAVVWRLVSWFRYKKKAGRPWKRMAMVQRAMLLV